MCPACGDQFKNDRGLAVHHNKKHGYDNIFGNRPHKKRALNKHVKCPLCDQLFHSAFYTITHKHACKEEVVQQEGNCSPHDDDTGEASDDFLKNDTSSLFGNVLSNDESSSLDAYLTDDAATSTSLVVPGVSKLGTQRYVVMAHELYRKDTQVATLPKAQQAYVVFWAAAQRGCMSGVQAQRFVDIVAQRKADFTKLPASLVTIRKHVEQVAERWCKRTAKVVILPVPELNWHSDVSFVHHDPIQMLADLVQDPEICGLDSCWKFKARYSDDGRYRMFGELYEGYWWEAIGAP